jgi:hypothetical protein
MLVVDHVVGVAVVPLKVIVPQGRLSIGTSPLRPHR